MGEKKKKEASTKLWKKILIVGACVLFVVLMIVSGMGSGWLSMFTVVKPGDTVVIDYTLFNAEGNPILTTDQQVYVKTASTSGGLVLSKQISLIANQTLTSSLYPVQIYTSDSGWSKQFAIFSPEYNAISAGLVGMKINEQKRIGIPSGNSMTQDWSADQLLLNKVNISDISVGDILAMGVSDNPEAEVNSTSSISYIRTGEVTQKTQSGVVVDFGYPVADIRIVSINKR
ncbi:MAG: hypothetical protein WC294_07965 [Methanoregula sp.]|jgi:hypothetical protein